MERAEPITDYLKRRLKDAGPAQFEAIAQTTGVTASFIRKFVYGSRNNPRVQTIQPLLDYFRDVDAASATSRIGLIDRSRPVAVCIDGAAPHQAFCDMPASLQRVVTGGR